MGDGDRDQVANVDDSRQATDQNARVSKRPATRLHVNPSVASTDAASGLSPPPLLRCDLSSPAAKNSPLNTNVHLFSYRCGVISSRDRSCTNRQEGFGEGNTGQESRQLATPCAARYPNSLALRSLLSALSRQPMDYGRKQNEPLFCYLRLAPTPATSALFARGSDQMGRLLSYKNWDPLRQAECKPEQPNDFRAKQKSRLEQNAQNPIQHPESCPLVYFWNSTLKREFDPLWNAPCAVRPHFPELPRKEL